MKLVNRSKGFTISDDSNIADSLLLRVLGLMLSKPRDLVLISSKEDVVSSRIHMLFMRFPIDVIWLNSGKRVVDLHRNIKPFNPLKPDTWRIYGPRSPARYVVELGEGELGTTEIGDELDFIK